MDAHSSFSFVVLKSTSFNSSRQHLREIWTIVTNLRDSINSVLFAYLDPCGTDSASTY